MQLVEKERCARHRRCEEGGDEAVTILYVFFFFFSLGLVFSRDRFKMNRTKRV